jgi:hypothetical protein
LDYDDHFITISDIAATANLIYLRQRTRKINNETVMCFQLLLKNETWVFVYKSSDTNDQFNSFLYSFLNIYEATFPTSYKNTGKIRNGWITGNKNILQTQEVSIYLQQELCWSKDKTILC